MAARNTAPMAPGGAASSRVCGIGGSPRNKQQPASPPIFVAEKLFDEFSLGRINAHHSPSSSGDLSAAAGARSDSAARGEATAKIGGSDAGFQPSAPPFECIGRSNVELYGFNDIFGGVPGIKSKTGSSDDDIFTMAGASGGGGGNASSSPTTSGGSAAPTHQRSSSSPLGSRRLNTVTGEPKRCDAETNQSQHQASGSGGNNKTSADTSPPPTLFSPKAGRESSSSSSGGPHGTSRLRNSGTDVKGAGGSCDRPNQRVDSSGPQTQQNKAPPYAVKVSASPQDKGSSSFQNSALLADSDIGKVASPPPPTVMPSCLPSVSSCSPRLGSGEKANSATSEAAEMKAHLNRTPGGLEAAEKRSRKHETDRAKEKSEEGLLPRENGSKNKSDTGAGNSSPRKSKRQSATERLKAVLFPDFGKKEDKAKAKSWFTIGDLKLVTKPTDVPPPKRAPPEMVEQAQEFDGLSKFKRDERWRRNSCEFPLGKGSNLKEAAGHMSPPLAQAEDFAGLSSSAMAMKEAVERAEAKLKQKKKSAEVFPEMTESEKRSEGKVNDFGNHGARKEGDIDKRAVERAAHELREKALKKAAERAVAAAGVENGRSTSAPKQRVSDEAERNAKKVFFSGEQCRPANKTETSPSITDPVPNGNLDRDKKQRRESTDKALEERAAKALAEKNQREQTAQQEQQERQRVSSTVDAQISAWVAGKEGNLRALLSSLHDVLWPGSGWQPVASSELSNEASIRKAYRKATLCVHPDKIQQRTTQEKLIAEKVFDLLKAAWTKFNSQEAFFWQVS
ncbi:auxilin-related protein 2 isoform X2 [Selaginella moellendorffii]|uniref:auxilin-related protein 2 isoform X2 n=1 Tax=Selaginella moellendorffii TaxID=88036 RepID=UPI000D1D0B0F|nr:auxilin-related protein 2 isoform X2 [Selaginella moellendorffii]|eukprot:XP_024538439.1 auxilin-related protein 2 isoform X2 [Selaginella moellendorffii]